LDVPIITYVEWNSKIHFVIATEWLLQVGKRGYIRLFSVELFVN